MPVCDVALRVGFCGLADRSPTVNKVRVGLPMFGLHGGICSVVRIPQLVEFFETTPNSSGYKPMEKC